ncbi:MAG: hypothetical protein AB7P40_01660 [Chloroflexota bacterium]
MLDSVQISARAVTRLLAHIFGPSVYDVPPKGIDPYRLAAVQLVSGPHPDPWNLAALNPQPLPPRVRYVLALADAHITELYSLDRVSFLLGGEVADRAVNQSLQRVAEIDELCPRWPKWPKNWPPPPPPPWLQDEMSPAELLLFGTRILAGAEVIDAGQVQEAMGALGQRAIELSMRGA